MQWLDNINLKGKLMGGFGLVLILVVILSSFAYTTTVGNQEANGWVEHTHLVIGLSDEALAGLVDMETGYRGYLVTGQDAFLDPYKNGKKTYAAKLEELTRETADNPAQVKRWNDLLRRAEAWQKEVTEPGMKLRQDILAGVETTENLIAFETSGLGKTHFDGMRAIFAEAIGAEKTLLQERTIANHAASEMLITVLIWGTVCTVLMALAIAYILASKTSRSLNVVVERAESLRTVDIANLEKGIQALSQGDLSQTLELQTQALNNSARDEVGRLSRTLDGILEQVESTIGAFRSMKSIQEKLIEETQVLARSAESGQLERRGNAGAFQGSYSDLVQGVNNTIEALLGPVNEATNALEVVAARDMTIRIKGDYKGDHARIKDALNLAVDNLDQGLSQVTAAAAQVDSASGQINSGSQSLAEGASNQASNLEEISASLEEVGAMSKKNASNAQGAKGMTDGARTSTQKGVDSMKRLSNAINRIKESSDETAKIVKTIDEIAFQTNLLALNAAVEAARAGEAGKGFAVVAEEVRNLAMRSAEAARNTTHLINGAVENADSGVVLNQEVMGNLEETAEQIFKVSEVMEEISVASDQQSEGIDQISSGVTQLNQLTQQNASSSEESAAAAEELSSQASEMQALVSSFQLSDHLATASSSQRMVKPKPVQAKANGHVAKPVQANGHAPSLITAVANEIIPLEDKDILGEF